MSAPSTTGDVSVSKGPALMPPCVAVNEFALYPALSTPAEPRAPHCFQACIDAAICSAPSARLPHTGASNPGQNPGRGAANTTRPLFLAWKASKPVLWGAGR